jgi:hypothetical protein
LLSSGRTERAKQHLIVSEGLFLQSGAEDRAASARDLLEGMDPA